MKKQVHIKGDGAIAIIETDAPVRMSVVDGRGFRVGYDVKIGADTYRIVQKHGDNEFDIARIRRITEADR